MSPIQHSDSGFKTKININKEQVWKKKGASALHP